MRLVVWSPIALMCDALGALLDREIDVEVVETFHTTDATDFPATCRDIDLLVVHAVPLDDCRRLFGRLDLDTQASLKAVYVTASPEPLFTSRARLFGFADVIDSSEPADSVIDSIRTVTLQGLSVGATTTWTFASNPPLATLLCPHCRDERDVEILQFIVDGHTDSYIAELMGLNAQTIRNRVSNMLLESGMSNRTQLAIDFYRAMLASRGVDTSSFR